MKVSTAFVIVAASLVAAPAHAGPCSGAIAKFQQAVRQSAANPGAGPMARQSIGAQLDRHRRPAPGPKRTLISDRAVEGKYGARGMNRR
jgi:hypothetical protein